MNNDFQSEKQRFDAALEARIIVLGAKWDLTGATLKTDERITAARTAGTALLLKTSIANLRVKNSGSEKEAAYLESLISPDFKPTLKGLNNLKEGTPAYADVTKFMKDLAFEIGTMSAPKPASDMNKNSQKLAAVLKMPFVSKAPEGLEVAEVEYRAEDWNTAAITIPAELEPSQKEKYEGELKKIAQKIAGDSSRLEFQSYFDHELQPLADITNAEYEARRQEYVDENIFRLSHSTLVDFKEGLDSQMHAARQRIEIDASKIMTTSPFPTLVNDDQTVAPPVAETATPKKSAVHPILAKKLEEIKSKVDTHIAKLSGDDLSKFHERTIVPKIIQLQAEVKALKASSGDKTQLMIKEHYIALFQATEETIMNKLWDETVKAQATPAVKKAESVKATISTHTEDQLAALKNRINDGIAKASVANLKEWHEAKLQPKIAELKERVDTLTSSGKDDVQLLIAQKHLAVLQGGAQAAQLKFAEPQTAQTEPIVLKRPANAFDSIPTLTDVIKPGTGHFAKAAFIGTTQRDQASAKFTADALPLAVIAPEAVAEAPEYVRPRLSLQDMITAKRGAKTVPHKDLFPAVSEKTDPVVSEQKTTLREKAKKALTALAVGAGAVALTGAAIFAGLAAGFAYKDAQKLDDALAKASMSAKADFNKAGSPSFTAPAPVEATVYVPTPANDTTAKAAPKAKVVDDSPKFGEPISDEAPKVTGKHTPKVEKSTTHAKAKADFRPAAAVNDANVSYEPGVLKAFDPLTMRADLSTLVNACKQAGVTGANTVCGSIHAPTVN